MKEAKEELYGGFVKNYKSWGKEEDLQSLLYCILVGKKEIPIKLVHREYPVLSSPSNHWSKAIFGELDLAVLDPDSFQNEFNLKECKIRHAIELKFPLVKQESGEVFCEDTIDGFVREYKNDYNKLSGKIENKSENLFQKHILFFEKFPEDKRLFESCKSCDDINQRVKARATKEKCINFDDIKFSYIEVYHPSGEYSDLLNNCGLKEKV